MNIWRLFWGILIVAIGVALLFNNIGILPEGFFSNLIQFWPLVLVLWGLSLLFSKNKQAKIAFSVISILLLLAVLVFSWFNTANVPSKTVTEIEEPIGMAT